MTSLKRKWLLVRMACTLVFIGTAKMVSAHSGDANLIHACVHNTNGRVRIVTSTGVCKNNEHPVDWLGNPAPPSLVCPTDSVPSGTVCVDKYEASVWETTTPSLIVKIKAGTVTLTDLISDGAIQHGVASDDYNPGCPDNGNNCTNFYAVSIPGVIPSTRILWFQAAAACRNAGKRLLTNAEWQVAALGTPDLGTDNEATDCNIATSTGTLPEDPVNTGSRSSCVSDVGAFDMVGNVWEWVADWGPQSTTCPGWDGFSDDLMCLAGANTTAGPGTFLRGGSAFSGPIAPGVLALDVRFRPLDPGYDTGLRCGR